MLESTTVSTDIPARLDRLPWSNFHRLVVAALGITWILDGLEVTIVGSLSGALAEKTGLALSSTEIGLAGSAYVIGAVLGALVFGDLADRHGRRALFTATVGLYLVATIATGLSWDFSSFVLFRALTGAGIGGEYSAINSAIQEFTPPERRGRVDLFVNGSYWIGAALGALGSLVVLDQRVFAPELGWRFAFIIGGVLAILVIVLRRFVPESPRWLMTHGRVAEAERVVNEIEARVGGCERRPTADSAVIRLSLAARTTTSDIVRVLLRRYPKRTVLGLTLMASQAFCYNAIFFTYALILTRFYRIPAESIGLFMLPFAVGNFLGPLLLGPLFDRLGRKPLIAATYAISAALLLLTGLLFARANLGASAQTALWTVNFFFASAGASAAYLTVGECFPLEMRARAIAVFYAFGTAIGGILGPALFGALIDTGARDQILLGYLLGAVLMAAGAGVAAAYGVSAERVSLEEVAPPLSRRD